MANQSVQSPLGREGARLFEELGDLRRRAGAPPLRAISKTVGYSLSTVHAALSGPRVPSWPVLSKIVTALDGDVEHFKQLWVDARERGQSTSPLPSPGKPAADVSLFVSYARVDDEATYQRISKLTNGIANAYRSLTGKSVGIFKDTESIELGDVFIDRIRLGLSTSSIFLAFLTPAYLGSTACREELSEYLGFVHANTVSKLILPILFAKHDRMESLFKDDDLWHEVNQLQWLDASGLRYVDEGSGAWAEKVEEIAERVESVLSNPIKVDEDPAVRLLEEGEGDEKDDGGLFEQFAALEESMPRTLEAFERLAELIVSLGTETERVAPKLERADTFSKKLAVSTQYASTISPIADEMSDLADRLRKGMADWDAAVRATMVVTRRGGGELAPDSREFFEGVKYMASSGIESLAELESLHDSIDSAKGISSRLDRPLGKLQKAIRSIADLRGMFSGWNSALEEFELSQPAQPQ